MQDAKTTKIIDTVTLRLFQHFDAVQSSEIGTAIPKKKLKFQNTSQLGLELDHFQGSF